MYTVGLEEEVCLEWTSIVVIYTNQDTWGSFCKVDCTKRLRKILVLSVNRSGF